MSYNRNKFGAKKHLGFDSKQEAEHYAELELLEAAGEITDLRRQVSVQLSAFGSSICKYRADASYTKSDGTRVLWESKGFPTEVYRIKKKLVLAMLDAGELPYDEYHVWFKDKREEWLAVS